MEIRNPHIVIHSTSISHPIGTTLDRAISSNNTNLGVKHLTIPSGDHLTLSITSEIKWPECMDKPLRYDKANGDMIRAKILLLDNKQDDTAAVQPSLSEIVLRHTPRARFRAKAFWCNSLNAKKKAILKLTRKRPKDPNLPILRRDYRKAIAQAKLEANGRSLEEETDPECFRTVKARQTRHPIPALEKTGGGIAAEHPQIAQELPDSLYGDEHHRANTHITAKAEPLNTGILNAAIRESPNSAASGQDHITTRLIKELCKLREDLFLRLMNRAWTQGIPDTWKTSNTILNPKAKKATYTVAKSWRPIQLQSILAKVLERAAVQRIADLGLLQKNIYGGRKQHGTTDAIQALNNTKRTTGDPTPVSPRWT